MAPRLFYRFTFAPIIPVERVEVGGCVGGLAIYGGVLKLP
jgi:hypothetical protein